ncbi:MAG: 5'-nucleotidase C-terminal domain-containing protein [Anaerostipes sp.]|jgi:raffinose/stachyose/melibiose transport system substrate-binding protein
MKFKRKVIAMLCMTSVLLSGCSSAKTQSTYTPENDIPSYEAIATDKTVITFGKFYTFDHKELESSLEKKFPEVDFVFEECSAGDKQLPYMKVLADNGSLPDIFLTNQTIPANDFLYDLGGENYAGRYNLSSLQAMTVNGHLYQIPVSNITFGIAYNKDLFRQNGWSVPSTLDELYALCDTISAEGIRPLVTCMKYYSTVESLLFGLSYNETFASAEKRNAYNSFVKGETSDSDILKPFSQVLKKLYDKGIVTEDDFSSSATTTRHDLYNGTIAMMPCHLDIVALAESEKPESEIGFIGFPTTESDRRVMQVVPGANISLSKAAMEDKDKSEILNDVMDYISTDEGQNAIFQVISGVSTLTSYQQNITAMSQDVSDCIKDGNIFFAKYFGSDGILPTVQEYMTGGISLKKLTAAINEDKNSDAFKALSEASIGTASETFTVLDTSNYNADVLRDATGAEIALVPNKSFFCGNIAQIFKGDIVLPERFTQKGIDGDAQLTTYKITGAKLKKLLEHPIIDGKETNILYAVSGLKVTYAPWAKEDKNVISVALADGTEIDDSKTYTVAAWPKAIDKTYIADIAQTFEDAGKNQDLMAAAIKKAGTIAPAKDGRITLEWDTDK